MQWMSIHDSPLPAPLCIQCTSQPLLALHQEINIKLWILFNREVSRLSLPPSSVCSSRPKMKASSRSCLLSLALVLFWWGQGCMQSGAALLTLTSRQQKTDMSQVSWAQKPLAWLCDDPWVKSCLVHRVENLADVRGARRSPVKPSEDLRATAVL